MEVAKASGSIGTDIAMPSRVSVRVCTSSECDLRGYGFGVGGEGVGLSEKVSGERSIGESMVASVGGVSGVDSNLCYEADDILAGRDARRGDGGRDVSNGGINQFESKVPSGTSRGL